MPTLKSGTILIIEKVNSCYNWMKTIKVVEKLGKHTEGGQGIVYKVECDGQAFALKWYARAGKIFKENKKDFYGNLMKNVESGPPAKISKFFIWPIAITKEDSSGCFGYVMKIIPSEYRKFSDFLCAKIQFSSFKALLNGAMLITACFGKLHSDGYSYQDLNDGNFFFNPKTGDVLICDNDNVAGYGINLGIKGKPRYMAPEVVAGVYRPDAHSDRFSLAIVLFLLLLRNHPLEGKRYVLIKDIDDPDECDRAALDIYCRNPIFILDPKDCSNRPVKENHENVYRFWPLYPPYIHRLFERAFEKSVMKWDGTNREKRTREEEWLKKFVFLRESLIPCPNCKQGTFFNLLEKKYRCMNCGKEFLRPAILNINKHLVPLKPGIEIYRYEVDSSKPCSMDNIDEIVGTVVQNKSNSRIWGIKNMSTEVWYRCTPSGKRERIGPQKIIRIIRGISIKFGNWGDGIIE